MSLWWYSVELYAMYFGITILIDIGAFILSGDILAHAWWALPAMFALLALQLTLVVLTYTYNNTLGRLLLAAAMLVGGAWLAWYGWHGLMRFVARVYHVGAGVYFMASSLRLATLSKARIAASKQAGDAAL